MSKFDNLFSHSLYFETNSKSNQDVVGLPNYKFFGKVVAQDAEKAQAFLAGTKLIFSLIFSVIGGILSDSEVFGSKSLIFISVFGFTLFDAGLWIFFLWLKKLSFKKFKNLNSSDSLPWFYILDISQCVFWSLCWIVLFCNTGTYCKTGTSESKKEWDKKISFGLFFFCLWSVWTISCFLI